MVTLFAQFLTRGMQLILILSVFPDLSGNIPTALAYRTYISQLIRYSRACHNNDSFSSRHSVFVERLFQPRLFICEKTYENILQGRYSELFSVLVFGVVIIDF